MKIIGICGSSGSGKSMVCRFFSENGISVLDCDEIYHKLVETASDCLYEIGENFGTDLIEGGTLDRKKLGNIVFSDSEKLKLLNKISHRHVMNELTKQIERFSKKGFSACVIDAPMLFEAGLDNRCDVIIAVISDLNLQLQRISRRDGINPDIAKKRIDNQISNEMLRERCDFVIENNGTYEELKLQCEKLLNTILTAKGE